MKKRIMFVSYLSGIGGGETFLLNHMRSLKDSHYLPMAVIGTSGALIDRCREENIPVFKLEYINCKGFLGRLRSAVVIIKIIKLIRENKISILHVNDMELGKYGAIAAKIAGIPVVWTCHGWWYSGAIREVFYRFFVHRTIAVSAAVQEAILRRGILSNEKTSVIHPGIDCSYFIPYDRNVEMAKEYNISQSNIVVSIIGRFQQIKGHITFLKAAREVARKVPEVVFLIVGDNVFGVNDDANHFKLIHDIVSRDLSLKETVRFVNFQKNMPKLFSVVDILVSASDAETFGMVHLEAMACGTPVVSTNVGGPVEIVCNEETGYLVPPGEYSLLAEKIVLLCRDSVLRKRLGDAGRKRAVGNFSIELQTAKYCEKIYSIFED